MDPLKSDNIVAKNLQVYAWFNALCGLFLSIFVGDQFSMYVAILFLAVVLFSSFMLYAFGEIIDLLHEIKRNTGKATERIDNDELPEL